MEKKLNIGIFCDTFYPMIDGVISVVNNVAKKLSEKHNVTVFVPKSRNKDYVDNFPYKVVRCKICSIPVGDYDLPMPQLDRQFKKIIKESKLDVIHLHSPFTIARVALKYAKKHNIPCVITLHSQFKKDFYMATKSKFITNCLLKYVANTFNKCDELWTMNEKCKQLSYDYGNKIPVRIIPNGCDMLPPLNTNKKQINDFRAKLCPNNEKLLLFVGRLNVLKNVNLVLQACAHLAQKNYAFKFVILGTGKDKDKFVKTVNNLHLENNVVFAGRTSNREELGLYYAASDLLMFPSDYDTDGLVKAEAAVYKTPTVFLENSLAGSSITDGVNGYFVSNNPEMFANKLVGILSNPKQLKVVGENAKNTLYVSWEQVVTNMESSYVQVINNKPNNAKLARVKKTKQLNNLEEDLTIVNKPQN